VANANGTESEIIKEVKPQTTPSKSIPKTMSGGPAQIFAMARKMLVWDEGYQGNNDSSFSNNDGSDSDKYGDDVDDNMMPLPRWHPIAGISDENPSFRKKPPAMNSMGYAGSIRRNSRKRNSPSMWNYALRTYRRMDATTAIKYNGKSKALSKSSKTLKIPKKAIHHESALVACSKLGLWQDALDIYTSVESSKKSTITNHMVLALIKACVRGSKQKGKSDLTLAQRREPLDRLRDILMELESKHYIKLDATHINPLAAAYQSLSLTEESAFLIKNMLENHTDMQDEDKSRLYLSNLNAKDLSSYSLLVKGHVQKGDWIQAVEALDDMTSSAGLYPNSRNLNSWNEISNGKRKKFSNQKGQFNKRRDSYFQDTF